MNNDGPRCLCMVLAGGESRRMGSDKLALPHPTEGTVLGAVVRAAKDVCHDTLVLVAPSASSAALELARSDDSLRLVYDFMPSRGPLAAIADAWRLVGDASLVLLAPGDVPGLSPEVLRFCVRRFRQLEEQGERVDGVLVRREDRPQPLLGVYDARAGMAFEDAGKRGEKRLMSVLSALRLAFVDASEENWPEWWTRPVHTPQDYEIWTREATHG